MNILVRQATIIDSSSPFHLQKADLLISDHRIKTIETSIQSEADTIIDIPDLFISPGWVDIFSHFNDPGFEFKETLETGANAAVAGGYTDIMVLPNTNPCVHNKAAVEYLVQRSANLPVHIHPIASITKNAEGKELAEMYDMHASGAKAFSDGCNSIQSPGLLLKALLYLKAIDKTIIQIPEDKSLSLHGLMHEGIVSTQLGLPGKPAISEELMIVRDIELVKYTGSRLHITGISSRKSVELIRQAKQDGIQVTCSVTPYHLYFTDADIAGYDTNLKVNPPLRSNDDKQALKDAVLDGTIDCIATHHLPEDTDHKIVEFEYARNGMIGLQTCLAVVNKAMPQLSPEKLVELMALQPRKIFDLDPVSIQHGQVAQCTLFSLNKEWMFSKANNRSRSANSPFLDMQFHAKAIGIINKGNLFLNNE